MIIDPIWTIKEIENLNYNVATIDPIYLKEYLEAGHDPKWLSIQNYFEYNLMPDSILKIKEYFSWNDCTVAINLLNPGQYLPLHSDLYKRYMEVHNIDNIQKIQRAIVMIESAKSGQFLQINDLLINSWQAGETFFWRGMDKHGTYNFSTYKRYAIQVTGWL